MTTLVGSQALAWNPMRRDSASNGSQWPAIHSQYQRQLVLISVSLVFPSFVRPETETAIPVQEFPVQEKGTLMKH